MIKPSYIFFAVGAAIFVFHRNIDALGVVIDSMIFSTAIILMIIGWYLRYKEKKEKPEAEDFN